MANQKTREKRRAHRQRKNQRELENAQDNSIPDDELDDPEVQEDENSEPELKEKDYYGYGVVGAPTSYAELDELEKAAQVAQQVHREAYKVQDLVTNILYADMTPDKKAAAIVGVGREFGNRIKAAAKVEKSLDMNLLQLKALLGRDSRHTPLTEKAADFLSISFKQADENSKAFIRKQIKNMIASLESGLDPDSATVREEVPALLLKAKQAGIGGPTSILIEKDLEGTWRGVLIPTNNFIDFDGEILSEKAHLDYVEWVGKNMDLAPAFIVGHIPGTAREKKIDFVGYENGFLVMSLPLTEKEAGALLRMQAVVDIGMSHGTFVLERDADDPNIITKYFMVEVSDLPLERAANPFTNVNVETLSKEAGMDVKQYLTGLFGEEDAEKYAAGLAKKQSELREEGVKEKEKSNDPTPAASSAAAPPPAAPVQPTIDISQVIEKLKGDPLMTELSDVIAMLMEKSEKVDVLESFLKQMNEDQDEKLAKMIEPPITKTLSWMGARATQKKDNVIKKDNPDDEKLVKAKPEFWLSEITNTTPVEVS